MQPFCVHLVVCAETPTPFTEPTPASPPLSYVKVSQNLFSDSGDASRKRAPSSPAKEEKLAAKKATVTTDLQSPFMRHLMLALKKQGKHHANLMKAISGPDFYSYQALFLQYTFGTHMDQDLRTLARCNLNEPPPFYFYYGCLAHVH